MTQEDMAGLIRELTDAIAQMGTELCSLHKVVEEQNVQVQRLVPKSRFRWLLAAFAAAAVTLLLVRDNDLEARERARQSDIAACERANKLRHDLRETITFAYLPRPVPPNLSPELAETFRLQEIDRGARRDTLLQREGLQHVDCPAQFPK